MKKIVLFLLLTSSLFAVKAQDNNPYNQNGKDYVTSIKMIIEDFENGNVSEINESTIATYKSRIPLNTEISMQTTTQIFTTLRATDFSFNNFLDHLPISPEAIEVLRTIVNNPSNLNENEYQEMLIEMVPTILNSGIVEDEKKLLLSLNAIAYQLKQPDNESFTARRPCTINGPDGSGTGTPGQCIFIGAVVGAGVGAGVCGLPCALGGAVVGAVVVAIAIK